MAHLDTDPRDAEETLVLLHGEELASKIIDFVRRTS